ncbi:hypothetical protein KEJ51_00475 [Candidatus Bathyarchaeota archaeon]|nr:hypothetical protein [Candidatus Bathyarchaeota archaeon]MBS7629607.1 hypothetical protein [Candidatus Bathyarchaeota archaeon]
MLDTPSRIIEGLVAADAEVERFIIYPKVAEILAEFNPEIMFHHLLSRDS